jgi:hypothetical protein
MEGPTHEGGYCGIMPAGSGILSVAGVLRRKLVPGQDVGRGEIEIHLPPENSLAFPSILYRLFSPSLGTKYPFTYASCALKEKLLHENLSGCALLSISGDVYLLSGIPGLGTEYMSYGFS